MSALLGLNNPASLGQGVAQAFQQGAATRRKEDSRNALAEYAVNPTQEGVAKIARYHPEFAIGESQRFQQQAAQAQQQDIQRRAALGDDGAMDQLAGIDLGAWRGLSGDQQDHAERQTKVLGNAAMDILNRPPEQQAAAFNGYIDQLSEQMPELEKYRGLQGPQLQEVLRGAVSQAELMQTLIQNENPGYITVPEGGTLVDTRNPQAVQQFAQAGPVTQGKQDALTFEMYNGAVNALGKQGADAMIGRNGHTIKVQTPEQARQLPSGTRIILPDGSEGRVP